MPAIFNVGNSYSPNNKKMTSKLSFDVGEKFSGKVIKGDNNEVTIKLIDGWEFSAVVEGDISDLQNVLQRFTVEGYENGKLKLKLIGKSSGDEEVSKDFSAVINKESLKGNDKELLEAMIKFDIPLTKKNIKEIKSLVQFLDKIKINPQEIEEFITKYLETKGIDVNSELGDKLGNTLKEFFTSFKGLTKEDILLFIESGIDFNKENIDSYNNIFKGNSSINDLLEEFAKANPTKIEVNNEKDELISIKDTDENSLTSSSKFAKDVYQKTDSNNSKVSMFSLLKSMTGKSEDIINVNLKEVLSSQRNSFTSQDFERIFNNISNMDSSDALQRFTVEGYESGNITLKLIGKSSGDKEVSKEFSTVISKESLKGNDKELLEAMIKLDTPLTEENIKGIKSLVQFSDKIKTNPQEIEEFITKSLETKGIDVNSELGEKLGNTLKEFFNSFKGLRKEDILLFIESGIDFNKENIDSYNNIFKRNSSINDLLEEFAKANPTKIEVNNGKDGLISIKDTDENNMKDSNLSRDENSLTSSNKFAKDVYQKTDSNNSKVSMLSLLKSMTGKSEDIINVTLKEVLSSQRNSFTSQDFERLFNNISNMDSSEIVEKLIITVNEYSEIGNDIVSKELNKNLEKGSNGKSGVNEALNFTKGQLDKVLSEIMGKNISLTNDEFGKLKDAINLKYSNMLEDGSIKEETLGGNQKVLLNNETLDNIENNENLKNLNEKEVILKNNDIETLKNVKALEDGITKNTSTKEVVQQIINKTGESNKEIIKDVLSALKSEGDISEKILTIIKNNINDIKVFNKFSGDYYYANIPVNIEEREYPCKLIVKDNRKEGKKIDSKNVKMVITIDTKNLGVVDSYMKVNDKIIDIDLKCEEKSVKILDMTKEKLMNNIESMGFSVKVKVYKKQEEVSLTTCRDFFNTGTKISLDRRV